MCELVLVRKSLNDLCLSSYPSIVAIVSNFEQKLMKFEYSKILAALQCSADGRPYESLYYTRYPNFYKIMNEAALTLNKLARIEDETVRSGFVIHSEKEAW